MTKAKPSQQVFVSEYLKTWNATQAAIAAGYSQKTARQQGSLLLTKLDIQEEISKRLDEFAMEANEVLARLATMARGDLSPFLTEDGNIDFTTEQAKANIYLLKKARVKKGFTKSGEPWIETEVELHDPLAALVHIGRHHGLFTDLIGGNPSKPLEIILKVQRDRTTNRTDDPPDTTASEATGNKK